MKRKTAILLGLFLFLPAISILVPSTISTAQAQESTYVGSSNSNKYHRTSCRWARKIKASNLVSFGSREDAGRRASFMKVHRS